LNLELDLGLNLGLGLGDGSWLVHCAIIMSGWRWPMWDWYYWWPAPTP